MARPRVSVIVPTFNRIEWLPTAVASVQKQTVESWELLVIDDGSTDGTDKWVDSLDESRLRYIRREHTGNIAAVRNVGIEAARGEWIAFLDSDDRWLPDKLARQFEELDRAPDSAWCYGGYRLIDRLGEDVPNTAGRPWRPFQGWIAERILTTEAGVTLPTVLVRADVARDLQFDTRIPLSEDYDFALRLAVRAPSCAVPGILAEFLVHQGRTTANAGKYAGHLGKAITYRKAMLTLPDADLRRLAGRQLRAQVWTLMRLTIRHGALTEFLRAAYALWRL
jgi:glycosyltransferase involved in cell wall biosynthesis